MTWDEFKTLTMPLAVQLGAQWDAPTWRMYFKAVEKIPTPLYVAALQKAAETRSTFPAAARMREMAEGERQALLAAHPYDGCIDCEHSKGWRTVTHPDGVKVERCQCRQRHLDRLAQLGVGDAPLALPAARTTDFSAVGDEA